ncbi:MAG: hypothetical protein ACK5QC_01175 [Bacteroidota bacterium]
MKNKKLVYLAAATALVAALIVTSCKKESIKPTTISESQNSIKSDNLSLNARQNAPLYTGEQIFEGIFLISGDFKDEIDCYKNSDPYYNFNAAQKVVLQNFQTTIINNMKASNPTVFSDLKTEIESGVASRIDASLDATAKIFFAALSRTREYSEYAKLQSNESFINKNSNNFNNVQTNDILINNADLLCSNGLCEPQQAGAAVAVVVVVYFAAAVHNTAAVTVNVVAAANLAAAVAVAIWKYKYFWSGSASIQSNTPLSQYPNEHKKLVTLQYDKFVSDLAKIY